ncbi:MAG: signal peptidase I [Victivallaceae bacterium]
MFNFSKKSRLRKEVKRLKEHTDYILHADDDILSEGQKKGLAQLSCSAATALAAKDVSVSGTFVETAPEKFRKIIPERKYALLREYVDVIAVAVVVAFGIRGLFLQPFKIPTSSMQPTLFGIHFIEKEGNFNPLLAKLPAVLDYSLFSCRRAKLEVKAPGEVNPNSFKYFTSGLIFDNTSFDIGDVKYTLPGEQNKVIEYSGINGNEEYPAGKVLCDGWLSLGDHLFVDRFSHHIVGLNRGDITVFCTEGIIGPDGEPLAKRGYYYIKRLVGLPGDTLKIMNNRLQIKPAGATEFKPVTDFSEKFKKIYSGKGGYHGHLNSPNYLRDSDEEFNVPEDCYFMMGDNSAFSSDSRFWGIVPRKNIVGKALFVFWPFSRRWGLADRAEPLPVKTMAPERGTVQSMHLQ